MTLPGILLGLTVALLAGALFHAVRGGGGARLLIYLSSSVAGFMFGQMTQWMLGWRLLKFGLLDLGLGLIGSLIFLALSDRLFRRQ